MPNLSDFNDQTVYNSRLAEENAARINAGRVAALTDPQRNENTRAVGAALQSGDPIALQSAQRALDYDTQQAYQGAIKESTPLLNEAQVVNSAKPGEQNVYTPGPNGSIGTVVNTPDTKVGARTRKLPGYVDPATLTRGMNAGVAETDAEFSQREANINTSNTQLLQQQQIKEQMKQDQKGKMPKFDTTQFSTTVAKIDELEMSLKNLSPELQAAVGYELSVLKNQAAGIDRDAQSMLATFESDAEIESQYNPLIDYAKEQDAKFKAMIDKNTETLKQVAEYNRDMLEIDKKIMENKAAEDEAKQIKANIQNERKLRRQLNALGIETDLRGLDFLTESIQKGQEALASLRKGNSLLSLKANLAIGEGYRLDVQKALEAQEGMYLTISSQTAEKLSAITNSIATAKSEKNKGIRETLKWSAEEKNKLELKTAEAVSKANYEMIEQQNKQLERDWERQKYEMEQKGKGQISELQSMEWTTKFSDIITNKASVKEFDVVNRKLSQMELAYANGRNGDEALIVLWEKILDPTSVVREGEFARVAEQQGVGSGILEKMKREARAFMSGEGGQPIPEEIRKSIIDIARQFETAAKDEALQDIQPVLTQVKNFNRMQGITTPIDLRSLPFLNQIDHPEEEIEDMLGPVFSDQPMAEETSLQDLPSNGSAADTNVLTGNVWYGSDYWKPGLDISAPAGSPITIPTSGTVVSVVNKYTEGYPNNPAKGKAQNGGWGNQVKIKTEDGLILQFSHLRSSSVKQGDIVSPGQLIASVGNTGNTYGATGNHLDLTIYENGEPWSAKKVAAYIGTRKQGQERNANISQLNMSPLRS